MFFLLMFAGIIPVVIIDAPLPKIASTADEVKQAKDNKNQLEVTIQLESDLIAIRRRAAAIRVSQKGPDGKFPWDEEYCNLVTLHQHKPDSHEVTLMPSDDTRRMKR